MSEQQHVLVVDDDADVRWMVQKYLSKHGYTVAVADGGEQMRELFEKNTYDLVILDVTMPGEDGLSLARYLREKCMVGIIMLTAASDVLDRIIGLELGADDYMTKPFEPRELLARVKSVLRRLSLNKGGDKVAQGVDATQVKFGACVLNLESRCLYDGENNEIPITNMEFDLLKAFADHPNKALSRDRLLNLTHNRDWDPYDRSIDIRIARLRRKIEPNSSRPRIIKTVRGAGYIFVTDG